MTMQDPRPDVVRIDKTTLRDFDLTHSMRRTIRVLVVVDGGVNHARLAGFGVGRFIELLRSTTLGCTTFSVDVAERGELDFVDHGPGGGDHLRYESFRFDSQIGRERVLDRYQEAFLFGINPGELGIPVTPIGEAERTAILSWMDAGNGIFATGDHENLGANLASGIPRVRSMRRWTAADGVPTVEGPTRLDTNQPETPAEYAGTAQIARDAEEDAIPQPLRWIPVSRYRSGWTEVRRPHEILCHPLHGPIDVMPDHPHEGTCFTTAEISGHARRRADFPGSELPQVIAQGFVVPDPPFQHHKGDVPASTIQMVSVYDGWKENVGRVVVDSTWHHWFNLNLAGIEAAGGVNWDKISRYFVNVAKWIAPPGAYRARCWWELLDSHFRYPGIEEFHPKASVLELGNGLRDSLVRLHGACTVRMLALDSICEIAPELCHGLRERFERPEPPGCLTCPPIELIERVVLGGFVRGTMPIAARVHESIRAGKRVELSAKDIGTAAMAGAEAALKELRTEVLGSLRSVEKMFAPLEAARQ